MNKVHLVRRTNVSFGRKCIAYTGGLLVALFIGGILLAVLGINPIDYYRDMMTIGLIGNKFAYKSIEGFFKILVPLLLTSIALTLSFKMRFWNIGGEGQFIVGSIMAAIVAHKCTGLPTQVVVLLMCITAMLVSGAMGLGIAALKVRHGTNETLVTLMTNYIALYLIKFLGETQGSWNFFLRTDSERPVFAKFPETAWMGGIKIGNFTLLYSVIITVLIAVGIFIYLKYTKQGYEISVVGDSPDTARYAGMKVKKIVLRTMFISAALIGLSGAFAASAAQTVSSSLSNNVGWTGIIVAWLGQLSVPWVILISFLISVLQYGSQAASTVYSSIDTNFADLLQSLILFQMLIVNFFLTFKIVRSKEVVENNVVTVASEISDKAAPVENSNPTSVDENENPLKEA